jgi:cytochrome-b5 reductase
MLLASYFSNRGKDGQGGEVIKSYTPTTLDSDVGHFELVIKVYNEMIDFISLCFF